MLLFTVFKFFLTAFTLCLPIPHGSVAPFLVIGALFGRFFMMVLPIYDLSLITSDISDVGWEAMLAKMALVCMCGSNFV